MKKRSVLLLITLALGLTACGKSEKAVPSNNDKQLGTEERVVEIKLSDENILVQGTEISKSSEDAVYQSNDIIFYLENQGIAYGEGTAKDEHSQAEADAHTVVHITEPGTYEITGTLNAGQIFIDLGEDAENDPEAVVNLILNNADITCTVAPAIFFYQVYECAEKDEESASMDVELTSAGANLIIADGSKNTVYGSYVAKIYKSCELSEDGTKVIDSKKLHKYDAAVYSKMSMNIYGDTGRLDIKAENEGLDTELHLNIHGGTIRIESGNDGINVNEDDVSVFEMNGGNLNIAITGETGEGDGIDSNGWLVINGGTVQTSSCGVSMDAGIDADKGIYINGGTVVATGNMNAEIAGGEQTTISFFARETLEGGKTYKVKNAEGNVILEVSPANMFQMLEFSREGLMENEVYSLWLEDEPVAQGSSGAVMKTDEYKFCIHPFF